jgi:hypothetical protein
MCLCVWGGAAVFVLVRVVHMRRVGCLICSTYVHQQLDTCGLFDIFPPICCWVFVYMSCLCYWGGGCGSHPRGMGRWGAFAGTS